VVAEGSSDRMRFAEEWRMMLEGTLIWILPRNGSRLNYRRWKSERYSNLSKSRLNRVD
jgi:hypothetical protein